MTQSGVRTVNVKWNISVPPEFDEATRFFLASQGGKIIMEAQASSPSIM